MPRKFAGAVRICRLEVSNVGGDWKEVTQRWHDQSRMCQQLSNFIWRQWLVWHVQNRSDDQLREWLDKPKKERGKLTIQCMPNELARMIYAESRQLFGKLHTRSHVLLANRLVGTMSGKKASKGVLSGWMAILLCHESVPSFTRGVPIPFDKDNAKLTFDEGHPVIKLKTELAGKGKAIDDRISIWDRGRQVASQIAIYRKIVSGEFEFAGSGLQYDQNRKKWFVMLSYRRPVHRAPNIDPEKVAYLFPNRAVPFILKIPGRRGIWLQSRGHHIAEIRKRTFLARRGRSANYRSATARKGKGREHSNRWRGQFSRKWSEFVRRVNHSVSHDVAQWCIAEGIGRVVYFKPSGKVAEHRAVSTLGAQPNDQSTWEFFQLKAMLEYKLQDIGVLLETVDCDGLAVAAKKVKG